MAQHPEERWTMPVETCAICDKDSNPLDVPSEACGHDHENRLTVMVEVVPALVAERLASAGNELLEAAQGLCKEPGQEDAVVADWRAALEAYSGDST